MSLEKLEVGGLFGEAAWLRARRHALGRRAGGLGTLVAIVEREVSTCDLERRLRDEGGGKAT